jgi:hypothetical protein
MRTVPSGKRTVVLLGDGIGGARRRGLLGEQRLDGTVEA